MTEEPEDLAALQYAAGVDRQAGALCWLDDEGELRFALITSRRTGRWVFPKGSIDDGMTPWDAAAQEALEEAGVEGVVDTSPIGRYRTAKVRPPMIWTVEIDLYPLAVNKVRDDWLEKAQRERRFVTLAEARTLIEDPDMIRLIERFIDSR